MGQNSKTQILHKNQSKITIFAFFVTTKIKKLESSKMWKFHQTTPNFYRGMSKKGIKYNIWNIWTIPEFFFLTIKMLTRQNFHFLQKTMEKITFFHFLEFQKFKNHDFSFVFCKKYKFWQVSILMARKKNFPGWSRWFKKWV